MPNPDNGSTTKRPSSVDLGMSPPAVFNSAELNFDAEDWFVDSPPETSDFLGQDPDGLRPFQSAPAGDGKGLLSVDTAAAGSPESPLSSFHDSSSSADSSSSKRTQSSVSANPEYAGGDVIMTNGLDAKQQDWNVEDYVHMEDGEESFFDGTVNPRSIEHAFTLDEYKTAGSSPNYDELAAPHGVTSPLPDIWTETPVKASPPSPDLARRGHSKAESVSAAANSLPTFGR